MGLAVGIDLGTTNSAIACVDERGLPAVIPNREGSAITPSVICFRDGDVVIGAEAKELQRLGTFPVAAFFKRQMGDPLFTFNADGGEHTPVDLSAMVLRKLREDAEARLGKSVTHAVITVPAYFRNSERTATIAAGKAAGLEVLEVINEPTAAAVAYGIGREERGKKILVYDLGGGTFDVTLLELGDAGIRVLTSDGDHQLGGKDWDERIVDFVSGRFLAEHGVDPLANAETVADVLVLAEDAKKRLTTAETMDLSFSYEGKRGRYALTRRTFEEVTADLMERTVTLTSRVLADVNVSPSEVAGVLLVGGSTRMPMVHRYIADTFGRPPLGGVNVDEAVALGAAAVAAERTRAAAVPGQFALRSPVRVRDVTNHSLGMIAVNADGTAYVNSIILPKNVPIPCEEMRPYQHRTRPGKGNELEVIMTQGDSDSPADVSYAGRYVVHDVPHDVSGMTVLEIGYSYDRSGTIQVSAKARGSAQPLRVTVEGLPLDAPDRFLQPPARAAESQHVTAYLSFDLSGSMTGAPLVEAQKAAIGFLQNCDLTHCSLGVVAFSDRVQTTLNASQNARAIEKAVGALTVGQTGGGNATHPFDEILSLHRSVKGARFAVVLTDGAWSDQATAVTRARTCHEAGIEVIAIGFGGADRAFLNAIASSDEGSFFTSMGGLVDTFSTIARVITDSGAATSASGGGPAGKPGLFAGLLGGLNR